MKLLRNAVRRLRRTLRPSAKPAETDAEESARKYWQREVAAEKVRRGTSDDAKR